MEIQRSFHSLKTYCSKAFAEYFGGFSCAFFDIETTGLSPVHNSCILGGVLFIEGDRGECVQIFAEKETEERELLQEYCALLSKADILISYNGNRFDLPFLSARLSALGLPRLLNTPHSFDLYRAVNVYSPFRSFLPNLKQKTLESYLGISEERKDLIDGQQSVERYREYLCAPSQALKEEILLHNRDDLMQLSRLMVVLDKLDLHRIVYHEGFSVAATAGKAFLHSMNTSPRTLRIEGTTRGILQDYHCYEAGYQATHLHAEQTLDLLIPCSSWKNSIYTDLSLLPLSPELFQESPAANSGYLILREQGEIHYREVNFLAKQLVQRILENIH